MDLISLLREVQKSSPYVSMEIVGDLGIIRVLGLVIYTTQGPKTNDYLYAYLSGMLAGLKLTLKN